MKRIFISAQLIILGAIFVLPMLWGAFQVIAGDTPPQQPARLYTTPYAPAPTPMTTPLVSDHVLLQDARVDTEAARLDLALTQEAAQAEADRIAGIIYATDSQRALEMARIAQQQELERQDTANERLRLALLEEQGFATRAAEQSAINMQLAATATANAIDAAGIVRVAEAQATATTMAAQAATVAAQERRNSGLAVLTLAVAVTAVVGLILWGCVKAYPHAVRVITEANMREARVTISTLPIPELPVTVDQPTAEVLPPPERAPIRVPRPQNNVIDTSLTVNDSVTPRGGGFIDPTAQEFTEDEKDRICEAYGIHKWISPTAAAVFGASNTVRNRKIKAVLIERNILQEEQVTA